MVTQKKIEKCRRVSLSKRAKRKLKSLTSNLNFLSRYLDGHLSVQEDNICATKDGMEKKNVGQKVLGMQKHKRICY